MKKILSYILSVGGLLICLLLLFGNVFGFNENIKLGSVISKNIFFGSASLNKTIIIYKSDSNISDYVLENADNICNTHTQFLGAKKGLFFFELHFFDDLCENTEFVLKDENKTVINDSQFSLNFNKDIALYNVLLDLDDDQLNSVMLQLGEIKTRLSIYNNLKASDIPESINFIIKKRAYEEAVYKIDVVTSIQEKREQKYSIPVAGYTLPTRKDKLPNANRGYRSGFTDGIHHSWDIDTPLNTPVVAIDDGIIVRVVNNWTWDDLSNLRKGDALNENDLLRNLDILRGNQIWIKTMKGELVMYNHLKDISQNIEEGILVKKGTSLGTIGFSGVPEEGYHDYHLDFSISENPYKKETAGKYKIEDYMKWSWKFKGQSMDYILAHQYDIFEK